MTPTTMTTADTMEEAGFDVPLRAAGLMAAFPAPWCVAGGWALDLFFGQISREHGDVEVAVFRDDQGALHDYLYLSGWSFEARLVPGEPAIRWDRREWLEPPVHEVCAVSPDGEERLEVLLNERRGRQWRYRRCPSLMLPYERAIRKGMWNVPVLAPEVVLLYKAKEPRPKDLLDFRSLAGRLDAEAARWLRGAIERAHPDSPFLEGTALPPLARGA